MDLPKRKHPRLKEYDYSLPGYYYVTIHLEKDAPVLSSVGSWLSPDKTEIRLSEIGQIAQEHLFMLEHRFPYIRIDKYIIMPTHIHAIMVFGAETAGDSQSPTLSDVVCAYKSLVTRAVNRKNQTPGNRLFQASFYETVLRNEKAYQQCWRYIDENPAKWLLNPEDI